MINKVIYGDQVLMDITDTTAAANNVVQGNVFYGANGARTVGTLGLVTTTTDGLMSALDKVKLDGINIKYRTTAEWNNDRNYVPARGEICIYSDHGTLNGAVVPGIKIGDGNAYCIDLPFAKDDVIARVESLITTHINNTTIHTSPEEKALWNSKITCSISDENLIFETGE